MTNFLPVITEQTTTSYAGFVFNPSSRIWKISRDNKIYLSWVDKFLSATLSQNFLNVLKHYAQTYSSGHASNLSDRFRELSRFTYSNRGVIDKISSNDLINYRATLDREHEWYLGTLRGFLRTWIDLGYVGIDANVPSLLDNWRIRGNTKGRAVQCLSPTEGPLSDIEFSALHQALVDAFEEGKIELDAFCLIQLFIATGRRPAQLGDLKNKDFIETQSKDGLIEFFLNVPRRKQRGKSWRTEFKVFALAPEVGTLLKRHLEQNKVRLDNIVANISLQEKEELPIFPAWKKLQETALSNPNINFYIPIQTQEYHRVTSDLSLQLKNITSALLIPSERTGQHIRVFPTRLRRTLATRAAREGFGELIIAELLDHTDTQNARVYTENVPEHVDAINEAVARQLAPLAQAFAGMVVAKESDANRGDDLTSRVRCESGNVGTCGLHGFCGALAPIACYTCRNFQPWIDGPHQEVLHSLIAERERILQITKDQSIASRIPMTRQEFNTLAMPTAHITEYGFCIHDFTMSPCQRFRDCLNCTEQVCIKGDRRLDRIKERHRIVKELRDKAAQEINDGTAGADRWYQSMT